jgi:hypothetical protein
VRILLQSAIAQDRRDASGTSDSPVTEEFEVNGRGEMEKTLLLERWVDLPAQKSVIAAIRVFNVSAWPLGRKADPRELACAENRQGESNRSTLPTTSLAPSKSRAIPLENTADPPLP